MGNSRLEEPFRRDGKGAALISCRQKANPFILSFAGRGGSGFFVTLPFLLHGRETIHGMAMIQSEQVQDSELSTQAVIYLGPSSMSLMVAEAVRDRIRLLDFLQQPVPMARDIFRFHRISRHTMDRCVQIIGDYLEILKEYGAGSKLSVRFMISNIISEADNVDVFVNRMHVAHGLRGRRIDDGKMTRLIYVKVQEALAQYPGFSKKKGACGPYGAGQYPRASVPEGAHRALFLLQAGNAPHGGGRRGNRVRRRCGGAFHSAGAHARTGGPDLPGLRGREGPGGPYRHRPGNAAAPGPPFPLRRKARWRAPPWRRRRSGCPAPLWNSA